MHIGKKTSYCPELQIDSWKVETKSEFEINKDELIDVFEGAIDMDDSDEERYLGDLITSDGSNKTNIHSRKAKGFGIIDKIVSMLEEISFGPNYFEIAILLRSSLFISSILVNSEVWYGLTLSEIEQLEIVDQALLKKILEAPSSTPSVGLYLDLGCLPIRFIIKARRIMFLHTILKQDEKSLVHRFFKAQLENPSKGDWSLQVAKDLGEIDLALSLDEIKDLSVESFRTKVRKAVNVAAFKWLLNEKKDKSKVMDIEYQSLKIQEYLVSSNLETREKKFLFQLRMRMIDVKINYRSSHADISCPLCKDAEDSQQHVLKCPLLATNQMVLVNSGIAYNQIYQDDVKKQSEVTRVFMDLWKIRKKKIKK